MKSIKEEREDLKEQIRMARAALAWWDNEIKLTEAKIAALEAKPYTPAREKKLQALYNYYMRASVFAPY
jgi:hypothetical protein